MKRYPIGPATVKRAQQTDAGKLAALLSDALYYAYIGQDQFGKEAYLMRTKVRIREEIKELPKGVMACIDDGKQIRPESLLLAIRDYLEWQAFAEVIP